MLQVQVLMEDPAFLQGKLTVTSSSVAMKGSGIMIDLPILFFFFFFFPGSDYSKIVYFSNLIKRRSVELPKFISKFNIIGFSNYWVGFISLLSKIKMKMWSFFVPSKTTGENSEYIVYSLFPEALWASVYMIQKTHYSRM